MECKEDILTVAEIERTVAPEVYGDRAAERLAKIERTVRMESEAGIEYYLIYRGGPAGFFSLKNEGSTVTLTKLAILPERRREGLARRALDFIRQTYDPLLLRIAVPDGIPALDALGFRANGDYYEMRYE